MCHEIKDFYWTECSKKYFYNVCTRLKWDLFYIIHIYINWCIKIRWTPLGASHLHIFSLWCCVCVCVCACVCVCVFYLDHGKQGAGEHPPELSSDVHQVHLAATHHHSDQGVVISSCTLRQTHKHKMMTTQYVWLRLGFRLQTRSQLILQWANISSFILSWSSQTYLLVLPSLHSTGSRQNRLGRSWHTSL